MARAHPAQTSFNAGELSPLLMGRPDLAKYSSGFQYGENMLPTVQGPAKRRGGLRFAAQTKNDAKVWLGRFSFSRSQSYVIEFGHLYVRFYANRAQLQNAGVPVEVATPYTSAQLTNPDGSFALGIDARGDVIYIASDSHPTKTLTRLGAIDWVLADFATKNGPLQDRNPDKALRLYAEARTGSTVDVTASANYFTASMVGSFLRLDVENFTMKPWEPSKPTAVNDLARSDGKTYIAATGGGSPSRVTGSRTPVHEEGTVLDGSGTVTIDSVTHPVGIEWTFRDPGYGIGRIVEVTSPTVAVVAVGADTPFPDNVVGSGNATNVWQIGAWGTHAGAEYPHRVAFWKNRLWLFGRRRFWASVPGQYDDFARDIMGQVRTDASITRALETTEQIRRVVAADALLAFTEGTEFVIDKATRTEPLGPENIDAVPRSWYGGRDVQPQKIGSSVLFSEPTGQSVREAFVDSETSSYQAIDRTVLAEHIAEGVIVDWAWQQSPDRVLWAVTAAGELLGFTFEREQDVFGWHRHPTPGLVEAVQVISSPDAKRDDVWLVVQRTVNGIPRRFVEVMDAGDSKGRAQEDLYYLDAGLTYSGAATRRLTGLNHLIGARVEIMVSGATHPSRVVDAQGGVDLDVPATKAHAGLHARAVIVPMPLEAGARLGSAQGATKRVHEVALRFHRTLGCKVGPSLEKLHAISFRKGSDPLGQAPRLYTGIRTIEFDGDYEEDGSVFIVQDQPLPLTLCAVVPKLVTEER